MKWKRPRVFNIPVTLLLCFFIIATWMTIFSQKNYRENLVEVEVVQPSEKALQYKIEYMAEYRETENGQVIQWEMDELGEYAKEGFVQIYPVYLENNTTEEGKLVPSYRKGNVYEGLWIQGTVNSESNSYIMETTIEEFPPEIIEAEFLMVELVFTGAEYEAVIPCSAIISPKSSTETSRVYVIEEIPKIWGTALSIKSVPVMILATNGTEAAIGNTISLDIIADVRSSDIYEGAQVKLPNSEIGGEENEEEK
ncbi:MAG: hypothetical protein J1E64_13455 [Acetatifactor sp.]|nr:hypothetical protein [Acetatifactor sp.]